jgi:hypothetical protein
LGIGVLEATAEDYGKMRPEGDSRRDSVDRFRTEPHRWKAATGFKATRGVNANSLDLLNVGCGARLLPIGNEVWERLSASMIAAGKQLPQN